MPDLITTMTLSTGEIARLLALVSKRLESVGEYLTNILPCVETLQAMCGSIPPAPRAVCRSLPGTPPHLYCLRSMAPTSTGTITNAHQAAVTSAISAFPYGFRLGRLFGWSAPV